MLCVYDGWDHRMLLNGCLPSPPLPISVYLYVLYAILLIYYYCGNSHLHVTCLTRVYVSHSLLVLSQLRSSEMIARKGSAAVSTYLMVAFNATKLVGGGDSFTTELQVHVI